jgi:LacI family transcriptional regulator
MFYNGFYSTYGGLIMAKKVSMEDLAEKLGISKNTVSLALRNMPGISETTRQLVLNTAKEMGYVYNKASETIKNLCVIVSQSTRNTAGFFNQIQFGVEAEARKKGINIIIYYFDGKDEHFEEPLCIRDNMVSGIITLGRLSRQTTTAILDFNLPLVIVDNYFDSLNLNYVLTDNISSAYIATEYLIKKGHSRLGFLGDIKASMSFYDRYQGFLRALSNYGLSTDDHYILSNISIEDLTYNNMDMALKEISNIADLPTAFFCCNDAEAIALNKVLTTLGIKVPEEISIMGFDDIDFSKSITPELTTMRVEKELMGKKAVKRLARLINSPSITAEKLLISTRLIERNSVKNI